MEKINYPIIVLAVLTIIVILFIVFIALKNKTKREPNYRALFIIGLTWVPIGISTDNMAFTGIGLIFMIVGMLNRKKWKERKKWAELTNEEKRLKIILFSLLTLLLIAGIVTFFVYN